MALGLMAAQTMKPIPVRITGTSGAYTLTVGGKPFFIKGAGGDGSKAELKALGGNSWRTWGADDLDNQLAEAQKLGMKLTIGIWLGHKEHGFRYDDATAVAKQLQTAREVIVKYRNHPALLMWGIGNEMESGQQDDRNMWGAVQDIARAAHQLDPNHPTMTVVAEIGGNKVPNINKLCPDIDIIGINSYGGAPSVLDRYKRAGGTKPYVLTEFGPLGQWEVGKTPWGAALEATSTQKAEHYKESYEKAVLDAKGLCLGSYAFTWGYKQEETATWFGMLLPSGDHVAAADVMSELWTGNKPKNRCPIIEELKCDGNPVGMPGQMLSFSLKASDPDGDPLLVRWVLHGETTNRGSGGSQESAPPSFAQAMVTSDQKHAAIRLPNQEGGYRLFVYITDGHGGAAVGNVPIQAKKTNN